MDFAAHLHAHFPKEIVDQIILSLGNPRTYCLLLNTNKISGREFNGRFPNIRPHPLVVNGYLYDKKEDDFGKHYLHDLGAYYIQEPAAMSVVALLSVRPGDFVLDLCAAPGGKTAQASISTGDEGLVIANDISHSRALILSQNIERLGLANVVVTNNDFAKLYGGYLDTFDKIILDAPCSGSGMFRKDEKMMKDWTYNKVIACQKEQLNLISLAYSMLKPGGSLAYSTCSFSKEENEDIIGHLLASSDAYLEKISNTNALYESPVLENAYYFLPSHFDGEGQFIALIHKPGALTKTKYQKIAYRGKLNKILEGYNLTKRANIEIANSLYSLNYYLPINKLNIIRYGVRAFDDIDRKPKPNHHLAHFRDAARSIELSTVDFANYTAGEVLSKECAKGYHLVSYDRLNAGFVHAVGGQLKNLLPKGLRRR
ncbi:MAG: hypothetical protein WC344_01860 [Bacilli bacterium]